MYLGTEAMRAFVSSLLVGILFAAGGSDSRTLPAASKTRRTETMVFVFAKFL